jgi:predicted phage terminase large subunit-like protein
MKLSEVKLIRSICKQSFFEFFKEFWSDIIPERLDLNWHIKLICDEAQTQAERVFKELPKDYDLVVNVPPGTSKSTVFSIMLPAWIWTRMPSARFIGGSYSFPLAMDLSRKNRDVVLSEKYRACFPEIELREDQNAKHYFANSKGGYRYAVGVNGSVMGMHAHFISIDDPLDPQEALSRADLDAAIHWRNEVLPSRKVNKAVTPTDLIMQRLSVEDPTAVFLARKAKVRHICLPAELTEDVKPASLRKYYVNGLLDPKRLPPEVLDEYRDKGQYYYGGQFLQNPIPLGGGMFKTDRLKYIERRDLPKKWRAMVRNWDKAGSLADDSSYTVGTLMGLDWDNRIFVIDVIRVKLDSYERESLIQRTARGDSRRIPIGIEQEPGSGGKESAEATVRRLVGYKVRVHKPSKSDGSKEQRADPFSVQVNAGNVYVVKNPGWNKDWEEELKHFPAARRKDQVDSASGAFLLISKGRRRVGGMRRSDQEERTTSAVA